MGESSVRPRVWSQARARKDSSVCWLRVFLFPVRGGQDEMKEESRRLGSAPRFGEKEECGLRDGLSCSPSRSQDTNVVFVVVGGSLLHHHLLLRRFGGVGQRFSEDWTESKCLRARPLALCFPLSFSGCSCAEVCCAPSNGCFFWAKAKARAVVMMMSDDAWTDRAGRFPPSASQDACV